MNEEQYCIRKFRELPFVDVGAFHYHFWVSFNFFHSFEQLTGPYVRDREITLVAHTPIFLIEMHPSLVICRSPNQIGQLSRNIEFLSWSFTFTLKRRVLEGVELRSSFVFHTVANLYQNFMISLKAMNPWQCLGFSFLLSFQK